MYMGLAWAETQDCQDLGRDTQCYINTYTAATPIETACAAPV